MSKLQKKRSSLKRGHPTLQNMNFYKFFLPLWVIFALLDPDPDSESGSGSTDPIESGSNPDPQPWNPEWVKITIRIQDEQPGSCFRGLRNNFLG
jgi:hypothetical protein